MASSFLLNLYLRHTGLAQRERESAVTAAGVAGAYIRDVANGHIITPRTQSHELPSLSTTHVVFFAPV